MQIESEPSELAKIKRILETLQVEKEALMMEKQEKNNARISEIEKELSDKEEQKKNLEAQFENEKQVFNAIAQIKIQIDSLRTESELAKRNSDFNKAAEIDYGKIPELQKQLEMQNEKWKKMQEAGTLLKNAVTPESIAGVVSRWSGIPIKKMLQDEKERILHF